MYRLEIVAFFFQIRLRFVNFFLSNGKLDLRANLQSLAKRAIFAPFFSVPVLVLPPLVMVVVAVAQAISFS